MAQLNDLDVSVAIVVLTGIQFKIMFTLFTFIFSFIY